MQDKWINKEWFSEVMPESAFSFPIKKKLHQVQSEFQMIEVFETESFGNLMVIDGCVMLTDRDNFLYHEMMSHPVLFTHPNPKNVVIIGGGDCGTLREVLKHPGVKSARQIDIDEQVTRAAEQFFPELCESNSDPRAHLEFIDGIKWMAEAEPGSIDIIIIDSTDPVGPGEVLVTEDFYQYCFNALSSDGLLVQQSESPLYHQSLIVKMHELMKNVGFMASQLVSFPQPCYPSGWWSATMAAKSAIDFESFRRDDVKNKGFKTRYYNVSIHQGALAIPEFMREALL